MYITQFPRGIHHKCRHPWGRTSRGDPYSIGILLTTSRLDDRFRMQRERVLGKNGRLTIRIREGPSQWVGDIGHVYMGSVSEKGVRAWAPSSVKMSGHGDIIQAPFDRRCDAGAYS